MISEAAKSPVPGIFAVETVLGCDLKCPECAIGGNFVRRKRGLMPFERFKIIADKIRPFCKYLYLHIWGEPMLNNDIYRMIEYAAGFTQTNISTNGQSLTAEKAVRLIRSGVTDIIVSIDGVSQNVYAQYRSGGQVDKAFDALKWLQHANIDHKRQVRIMPQFIVMRHNQHEMPAFTEVCASMGLRPTFKSPYIRQHRSRFSVSDDARYQRPTYPDINALKAAMRWCESVRKNINILLDGSVVACCHDYGRFTCFGNLLSEEVETIWNSAPYLKFRQDVISGNAPDFCTSKCMSYFLESGKGKSSTRPEATVIEAGFNGETTGDAEASGRNASESWDHDLHEQAWRLFLKVLALKPVDTVKGEKCFDAHFSMKRYEDALQLIRALIKKTSNGGAVL